jgi:hypothetical protein
METMRSRTHQLDFDALYDNFAQGVTMKRLQQELAQSQACAERSAATIKQLAAEFRF